jgi:cytoskeleton protein RodZ
MAAERKGDFGSTLRLARERRGVSLRQIAARTKISVGTLEALERNDISRLPGGIFSRAFVRSYAAEIGLDPEEAIQTFIAQFPHDSVTAGHPQAIQAVDDESLESDRRTASAFLKLIAMSLPIAGVVLYFGTAGRARKPPPALADSHPIAGSRMATPHAVAAAQAGPTGASALERVTVEIVARRPSAITVTIDGAPQGERRLDADARLEFAIDRELVLTVADPAAISVRVNGEPARPLGVSDQPATIVLTPANYKEYLITR